MKHFLLISLLTANTAIISADAPKRAKYKFTVVDTDSIAAQTVVQVPLGIDFRTAIFAHDKWNKGRVKITSKGMSDTKFTLCAKGKGLPDGRSNVKSCQYFDLTSGSDYQVITLGKLAVSVDIKLK